MCQSLELPALTREYRWPIGRIMRILHPPAIDPVDHVEDLRVSPRRTEALYILASGERIVVTARPSCPTPDDIDGVLLVRDSEAPKWLAHRLNSSP